MVTSYDVEHEFIKLKAKIHAGISICVLTEGEVLRGAFCVGDAVVQGAGRPDEAVHELRPPPETLLQSHHEGHQQTGGAK